jgi:outer membrane protein assembly factor BamD (BamD/ComL family)
MIRRIIVMTISALLLAGVAISQKNDAPEAMLRVAMDKEIVDGDLKSAIEQYKKIIAQRGASRELVAKALVRLGICYEKQGSIEARQAYERVTREFTRRRPCSDFGSDPCI